MPSPHPSTTVATIRATIAYTKRGRTFVSSRLDGRSDDPDTALQERGAEWGAALADGVKPVAVEVLAGSDENVARFVDVRIEAAYPGSWIIEAAVVMTATTASVYRTLEAVAKIEETAAGIERASRRIRRVFHRQVESRLRDELGATAAPTDGTTPKKLVRCDVTVDATALREMRAPPYFGVERALSLRVALDGQGVLLQNRGTATLRDIEVELFTASHTVTFDKLGDPHTLQAPIAALAPMDVCVIGAARFARATDQRPLDIDSARSAACRVTASGASTVFLFPPPARAPRRHLRA